jgi:hypothetical protein
MACWLLQKDEKIQDASAITTKQWILPPPPLSVEVFPAKVSQLAEVPSCQAECTYPLQQKPWLREQIAIGNEICE